MTINRSRFSGKCVLVTGGATGIGRAAALAFAREGASVVIGDVDDRAEEVVSAIREQGGDAIYVHTNVTDPSQVDSLIAKCVNQYGRLDCAFNNAGILPDTKFLHETTDDIFDQIIAVDVKGVFNAMRAEILHMMSNGGGSIVNTASVAGVIADPGMSVYVAAKHAVVGLTKAAAIEYADKNVRINAIAPGLVETPMTRRWLDNPEFNNILMAGIPMKRPAQPEEMCGAVLYLCSDDASFTTGQLSIIDGGQTSH